MTEFDQTGLPLPLGDVPKPDPVSACALSADLRALAEHFQDAPVRLREVIELLDTGSFKEVGLVFLAGLITFTTLLADFALLALGGEAAIREIWHPTVDGLSERIERKLTVPVNKKT